MKKPKVNWFPLIRWGLIFALIVALVLVMVFIQPEPEPPDEFGPPGPPTLDGLGNSTIFNRTDWGSRIVRANSVLNFEWNMVSMPETMDKTDIYFTYNNSYYNWTNASEEGLIFDRVWAYSYVINDYLYTDTLYKYHGYWIFVRVDEFPMYISSEPDNLYCKNISFTNESNVTLYCNNLYINPNYTNAIVCKELHLTGDVIMVFPDEDVLP